MARLWIMRHAHAVNPGDYVDASRPLSERGHRECREIGLRMQAANWRPRRILVSSAQRTRETLAWLLSVWSFSPERVDFLDALYEANERTLLTHFQGLPEENVMVIAHNPGVSRLICQFGNMAERDFPPASLACVEYDPQVAALAITSGHLLEVLQPSG